MPFKSVAQKGYLWSEHPDIAARWSKETPNQKSLPKHVKKKKESKNYDKEVISLAMKKHEKT